MHMEHIEAFHRKIGHKVDPMDLPVTDINRALRRLNTGLKKKLYSEELNIYEEKLRKYKNAMQVIEAEVGMHDYFPSLRYLIEKIRSSESGKNKEFLSDKQRQKEYEAEQDRFLRLWQKFEKNFGRDELFKFCKQHAIALFGSEEAYNWLPKEMRKKYLLCAIFDLQAAGTMDGAINLAKRVD